jgi:hypothetical protein
MSAPVVAKTGWLRNRPAISSHSFIACAPFAAPKSRFVWHGEILPTRDAAACLCGFRQDRGGEGADRNDTGLRTAGNLANLNKRNTK